MQDGEIIDWLLGEDYPAIRYWTQRMLLNLDETHPEVLESKQAIMKSEPVTSILAAQNPEGYWVHEEDMYLPKYMATTHQLLILAEHAATKTPMIEKAIEHIYMFQRNTGHFLSKLPKSKKGYESTVKDGCCFDGNVLYYLNHFGYLDDPRTEKQLDFIYDYHDDENNGWKCRAYPINPDRVFPINCYMGAMKILKAFSMIPEEKHSPRMKKIIKQETEKILENRIHWYLRNPDGTRKEKAGWKRFGYPLFYQSDILEVLTMLTRLGVKDDRVNEAVEIIRKTQQPDGRWLMKDTFNGKMWIDIEEKDKPSKWVTLRALYVLRNL